MNNFKSAEIRWFYQREGEVIAELKKWFSTIEDVAPIREKARSDFYYRLGNSDTFGIKLRMDSEKGKIETKELTKNFGSRSYHQNLVGEVQQWIKWSMDLAQENDPATSTQAFFQQYWQEIIKTRQLRKYGMARTDNGYASLRPVSEDEQPEEGCALEITEISANNKTWFSLGFEAFGAEENLRDNLAHCIDHVLARAIPPPLASAQSMSYYGWLDRFIFAAT